MNGCDFNTESVRDLTQAIQGVALSIHTIVENIEVMKSDIMDIRKYSKTIQELKNDVADMRKSINDIQSLRNDVIEIRKSSNTMQDSLSIMEILMCTQDPLTPMTVDAPLHNVSAHDSAGFPANTTQNNPKTTNDLAEKGSPIRKKHDSERLKSVVNVSDSDEDDKVEEQSLLFANLKMESPSMVGKPQLPNFWIHTGAGSSKKNKAPLDEKSICRSEFKRKAIYEVS